MDYGDPRLPDRYWIKVYPCPITGCFLWGAAQSRGYGSYWPGDLMPERKNLGAHVAAWIVEHGPVPDGLELDHYVCDTTLCVNTDHMRACTPRENTLRSNNPWVLNGRKTHCDAGHLFDEANTYIDAKGSRICRACKLAWYHANKAVAA